MTDWPDGKIRKPCAFSEEDTCVVSKAEPTLVCAGAKIMYSGCSDAEPQQASGYNYFSGETDLEPVNWLSGTSKIRIPEIGQLQKLFVFPKNPIWIARTDYNDLTLGTTSGLPSGWGGCSGKVAQLHWQTVCSGCSLISGEDAFLFNSGIVDYIAFGSIY